MVAERAAADISIGPYDPANHRPGTKGAEGRCSWTEDCASRPRHTAVAEYRESGRRFTWALCDAHADRVREYFSVA